MVRVLYILAAILTIANFVLALPSLLTGSIDALPPIATEMVLPMRFVVTIVLECSLAYFFGLLIGKSTLWRTSQKVLAIVTTTHISAWVSIFNLEYILIGRHVQGFWEVLGLFALIILDAILAILFIIFHIEEARNDDTSGKTNSIEEDDQALAGISQAIAFIVIFVLIIIRKNPGP